MNDIIPLFKSHYSVGKSTLNLNKAEEINVNRPISIFSIAKKYDLKEVYLVESKMGGFIEAYENSENCGIPLRFGIKLTLCSDINDKTENSFITESKIIIWLKNFNKKAKSLNKIYTKAATDGFYYIPRIDLKNLKELWDDDLVLSIPPYDSFLHENLLRNGQCVVDFDFIAPTIFYSRMNLPFDEYIISSHLNYAKNNNLETVEVHPVYFFDKQRFYSYQTFRCISERNATMTKPNLDHFSSKDFNFESYLNKIGKTI